MKTIVSVSGGLGSAYALKMCIEQYGRENVIAVFADVKGTGYSHFWSEFPEIEYLLHERFGGESPDTYRFIWQLSHALDIPIHRLEDGRSIWSIFGETRSFLLKLPNGDALCKASEILKREMMAGWIEKQGLKASDFQMALGMLPLEDHRVEKSRRWWTKRFESPVHVFSPMCDQFKAKQGFVDNCVIADWLNSIEVEAPKAYEDGFGHNNCMGICTHAGQNQFANLYRLYPERYLYAAWQEMRLCQKRSIDATILKMERGGVVKPISLLDFIELIVTGQYNKRDNGSSCSCFTSSAMTTFLAEAAAQKVAV